MSVWSRLSQVRQLRRTPRGTAELSVVVVVTSLVAGVLFGNGLTRTTVNLADGLTWLADDPSGDVIQINPATGKPEYRFDVAGRNQDLEITQYDGRMFVLNHTTGQLTSFDLSTLLASGQRDVASGSALKVLHHDDEVFLVDTHEGTVAGIDPVTTDPLGQLWLAKAGIIDATIDGQGRLWVLDSDGVVTELRWSGTEQRFFEEDTRPIDHSGPNSVIVGHERGATVFGPDEGIVVQVNTGHDVVADEPQLTGRLAAPAYSSSTVVPVSSPEAGLVFIVSGNRVWSADVRSSHCRKPDRPEAFGSVVYVPCPGDNRVLRLSPEGSRAAADIMTTPGGVPELVVDDDNLMINVQGSHTGVMVEGDGSVHQIHRYDDSVTPTQVETEAPPPSDQDIQDAADTAAGDNVVVISAAPSDEPSQSPIQVEPSTGASCSNKHHECGPGHPDGSHGPHDSPSSSPSDTASSSPTGSSSSSAGGGGGTPTPNPISTPASVSASALPDGRVQVDWSYSGTTPDSFVVAEVGGAALATVGGGNLQAVVTVSPGSHQFTVTAQRSGDPSRTSAPSAGVATSGRPDAPSGIGGSATGSSSNDSYSVTINWSPAGDNGSPVTSYSVTATDNFGSHPMSVGGTSASYSGQCGDGAPFCDPGTINVTVTAANANGTGPAAGGSIAFSGPFAAALPAAGAQLVSGHTNSTAVPGEWPGSTHLTLNPPGDWASFSGTCSFAGSSGSGTIPCGSTTLTVANDNPGNQSITFTATNRRGTVSSEIYTWGAPIKPCNKICP